MTEDSIVTIGSPVKHLGGNRIGGHCLLFTGEADPDLTGEYFTAATDFWAAKSAPVLYHHGQDPRLGKRRLGLASLKADEVGLWAEAELAGRDAYERKLVEWAKAGKLSWSTGSADHLRERRPGPAGKAVEITSWPIVEVSLTLTPAEPRARVLPLKALLATPAPAVPARRLSQLKADLVALKAAGRPPTDAERGRLLAYRALLMDVVCDLDRALCRPYDSAPDVDTLDTRARLALAELEAPTDDDA